MKFVKSEVVVGVGVAVGKVEAGVEKRVVAVVVVAAALKKQEAYLPLRMTPLVVVSADDRSHYSL